MNENTRYIISAMVEFVIAMGGGILAFISYDSKKWVLMIIGILVFFCVIGYFIYYGVKNKIPFIVNK